jgi:hypothetical protein
MAGTVKKVNKKQDEWLRAFHRCGPFLQVWPERVLLQKNWSRAWGQFLNSFDPRVDLGLKLAYRCEDPLIEPYGWTKGWTFTPGAKFHSRGSKFIPYPCWKNWPRCLSKFLTSHYSSFEFRFYSKGRHRGHRFDSLFHNRSMMASKFRPIWRSGA